VYNEGVCQVFKTHWQHEGRTVEAAAKVLKVTREYESYCRQEALKTSAFQDVQRIVRVYDVQGEELDENSSYVVIFTEWCPGIDL